MGRSDRDNKNHSWRKNMDKDTWWWNNEVQEVIAKKEKKFKEWKRT